MAVLSLANLLWSLLILFFMIVYFIMLYQVIVDLFHRHDVSGPKKAVWFVFWLVLPIISLIAYLYVHGDGIAQRTFAASTSCFNMAMICVALSSQNSCPRVFS